MGSGLQIALGVLFPIYGIVLLASMGLKQKSNQKMKHSMNDLQVTRAEEGQVVPIVYGTVRVPGSIIWYGNFFTKRIKAAGAKGGSADTGNDNFDVYLDTHFVLCEGKITLDGVYKDEEEYDYDASLTFNDGTTELMYSYAEFATKLTGIAHVYFRQWYLGANVFSVPSLSFKVTRIIEGCPITSTVTTGENPAVVVWDLLRRTGASIDEDSFIEAAKIFNLKNIGLNLIFDSQEEIFKMLEKVFSHVDLVLYAQNGVYYLKELLTPQLTTSTPHILENEVAELVFTRVAYNQVLNDFAANYTDANNTQRTIRLINEAIFDIVGEHKNHSFDFTGFNNEEVVKLVLSEKVKRESYPTSEVKFQTSLKYYDLELGDIFRLSYSAWNMVAKPYRVQSIKKNPFENKIEITAREYISYNFLEVYYNVGTPLWQDIDMSPQALDHIFAINFRYGKYRDWSVGKIPTLLAPAKKTFQETGYDVYYSLDGEAYHYLQTCYGYFYSGTLKEAYTDETYTIDDTNGILIDFDESKYPLDNITREELFTTQRVVIIGNEIMKFQTATEEGEYFRLLGIVRNDDKEGHSIDDVVIIGNIVDSVVYLPIASKVWVKLCPRTFRGVLDLADVTAIEFTPNTHLDTIERIKAVRDGDEITIEIWPNINSNRGCGIGSPDVVVDTIPHPFDFVGSFILTVGINEPVVINSTEYNYNLAGEHSISIIQQYASLQSVSKTLTIGADDGEYIS